MSLYLQFQEYYRNVYNPIDGHLLDPNIDPLLNLDQYVCSILMVIDFSIDVDLAYSLLKLILLFALIVNWHYCIFDFLFESLPHPLVRDGPIKGALRLLFYEPSLMATHG